MTVLLATLFVHAVTLAGWHRTVMLFPLCLAVALVYKTIKCAKPGEVPLTTLILWVTLVAGMYAVGLGLWGLYLVVT